jgi:transposase
MVPITETCEEDNVHLITNVETTEATVHEAEITEGIHQALVEKELPPGDHLVDSAYIDAELFVDSCQKHQIDLIDPDRLNNSWQAKTEGAYDLEQFAIDWDKLVVYCPQGKQSGNWKDEFDNTGAPLIYVQFSAKDCQPCSVRQLCTRSKRRRGMGFRPREPYEALQEAWQRLETEEGKRLYEGRAGMADHVSGFYCLSGRFCCGDARDRLAHLGQ